ncbi:hypothetical protein M0638_01120 [Roseomonas sp. NAR14]|uniref:DUF541 domain-containing protein n=1 Tax=Roseomonas acroporae TaxID=2937791 RepID=A0A9X1Y4N2_9PROT|nr:hypothetical protein [Roseomonas acroporae]MCK8782980.1 hypothetical protein [Roseomonas acroporae]
MLALALAASLLAPALPGGARAQGLAPDPGLPAEAPAGPNFAQRNIPAEATAEDGVVARERALTAGRRTAWERLAAEAGAAGRHLSDAQIEGLVDSIVIERERTSPTRYAGRITVNFNPNRARRALGGTAVAGGGGAGGGAAPSGPPRPAPASSTIEAEARYLSLAEWVDLQRRLRAAPDIASVSIVTVAVDAARLRLGLRAPAEAVAGSLQPAGVSLATGPAPGGWRVGIARIN